MQSEKSQINLLVQKKDEVARLRAIRKSQLKLLVQKKDEVARLRAIIDNGIAGKPAISENVRSSELALAFLRNSELARDKAAAEPIDPITSANPAPVNRSIGLNGHVLAESSTENGLIKESNGGARQATNTAPQALKYLLILLTFLASLLPGWKKALRVIE